MKLDILMEKTNVSSLMGSNPFAILGEKLATLDQMIIRSVQRKALRNLSDDVLKDIGISRYQAEAEANKWFWQD